MLKQCVAVVLTLIISAAAVLAKELPLGCYTNTYNNKHMAKHEGQSITSIKVLLKDMRKVENAGAPMNAEFELTLRGQGKVQWGDEGLCSENAGEWKCQIECDGGGFELVDDESGLTFINSRGFRITKDGGCGEETDFVEPKTGNRMFRLSKAKLSACKF